MMGDGRADYEKAADSTEGFIGDVEMAGETTAAAAITGPTDKNPVGADTLVKVADKREPARNDEEENKAG
jgi:hypothetical protein